MSVLFITEQEFGSIKTSITRELMQLIQPFAAAVSRSLSKCIIMYANVCMNISRRLHQIWQHDLHRNLLRFDIIHSTIISGLRNISSTLLYLKSVREKPYKQWYAYEQYELHIKILKSIEQEKNIKSCQSSVITGPKMNKQRFCYCCYC